VILKGFGDTKEIAALRGSIAAEHGVQVRYEGATSRTRSDRKR